MRVIAGTFRSRLLQAPRGLATRPTSDRLRETLFNVLGPRVEGCRFADLYAGSGAVGIEALSRGAAVVYFAEKAPAALNSIRSNLRLLGIRGGADVETGGTAALLRRLDAVRNARNVPSQATAADAAAHDGVVPDADSQTVANGVLDIVFLDPPYEAAEEYRKTLTTLGTGALLQRDAVVVAEHTRRDSLLERYGALRLTRTLLQGDAALSFYDVARQEQP